MNKIDIKVGDIVKLKSKDSEGLVTNVNGYFLSLLMKEPQICHFNILDYRDNIVEYVKRPYHYKTIYKRKEPILDDKEKEYLSAVIKPFKIEGIAKKQNDIDEYICIYVIKEYYTDVVILPYFKKGTMYKGMELDKEYTLEELGL